MLSFNSTLVRFKQRPENAIQFASTVSIPLWFDSNRHGDDSNHPCAQFQFHSGSIQTAPGGCCEAQGCGFNSTLVRFKPLKVTARLGRTAMFQFHSGSIQTASQAQQNTSQGTFQFHSGSIQTMAMMDENDPYSMFQFHSGSIQTNTKPMKDILKNMFQFHSGSIQTGYVRSHPLEQRLVSIPLWFDSNLLCDRRFFACLTRFNSTLVRFKRQGASPVSDHDICFNSTLVRFKPICPLTG